jgi:hypothetical protein
MLAIDTALQDTCDEIRDQAARGQITAAERDLMIDGAILLANALLRDPLLSRSARSVGSQLVG